MTASVRALTAHARKRSEPGFTQSAGEARALFEAFVALGYDPEALLAAGGLLRSDLEDPDARFSCTLWGAWFGCAQRLRPRRNLAAHLACATPIGAFPLLDYLIVTAETVGDAVRQLARYFRLLGAPIAIEARESETPIRVTYDGLVDAVGIEYAVALAVLHLREEAPVQALDVRFRHQVEDAAELEALLGCPVRGGDSWDGFALPRQAWSLPMRRRDPVLRALLERQAGEITVCSPDESGVVFEVRRVLASRVPGGDTRLGAVARALAVSPRTLQRRLAAAGESYEELLDRTRRESAERYLTESSLSIGEVGYLLGYSEPSAFHRAFKRWSGAGPLSFRTRHRAGQRPPGGGG